MATIEVLDRVEGELGVAKVDDPLHPVTDATKQLGSSEWNVAADAIIELQEEHNAHDSAIAHLRGTLFDVRDFGAISGDVGNQAPAIQEAIDAAAEDASLYNRNRVIVRGGIFRSTQKLLMRSYVTLEFVDATLHATSDCAIECVATQYGQILRPYLKCDINVSGIRVIAGVPTGGHTRDILIDNPTIELWESGTALGIDFQQSGSGSTGGDLHYFPRIVNPKIRIRTGDINPNTTAIKIGGTFNSSSVRGRIEGGTYEGTGKGIDMDHCNTWTVSAPVFNQIHGFAMTVGSDTTMCGFLYPDFEDCGGALNIAGTYNWCVYAGEFTGSAGQNQLINSTNGTIIHNGMSTLSTSPQSTRYARRQIFNGTLEIGCYEVKTATSGATLRNIGDDSGALSPRIRIYMATPGNFSIGSLLKYNEDAAPTDPSQGMMVEVHLYYAVDVTILHEDGGEATATKRINTLSGANEAARGPCIMYFRYDMTRNGYGLQRFVYLGTNFRQAAPRSNSTAATVGDLVTDFNDLLAKLRAAGIVRT